MSEIALKMWQGPPNRRGPEPKEHCVFIVGQSFSILRDALKNQLPNVMLQGLIDTISCLKIYRCEAKLIIFDTSFYDHHSRDFFVDRLRKELGKKVPVIFISTGFMTVIDLVTARLESGHRVFNPYLPKDIKEIGKLVKEILKVEGEKDGC